MCCGADLFLGLLAILFPPLPVWVRRGICSADSLINIALCVLGYLPGLIHAWYIIAKYPESHDYEQLPQHENRSGNNNNNNGRLEPIYGNHPSGQLRQQQPGPQRGMNYGGTTNGSGAAPQQGEGSRQQPPPPPPTYAEAIKGDNKVQSQD
ncbi:putative stress response RCI peptide [Xylariomycetidae sp. FL2044]|nr:putative stress response RCI peptide [Xylariomycetidae sp. FL2044]